MRNWNEPSSLQRSLRKRWQVSRQRNALAPVGGHAFERINQRKITRRDGLPLLTILLAVTALLTLVTLGRAPTHLRHPMETSPRGVTGGRCAAWNFAAVWLRHRRACR